MVGELVAVLPGSGGAVVADRGEPHVLAELLSRQGWGEAFILLQSLNQHLGDVLEAPSVGVALAALRRHDDLDRDPSLDLVREGRDRTVIEFCLCGNSRLWQAGEQI